jgi:hypothetical protein
MGEEAKLFHQGNGLNACREMNLYNGAGEEQLAFCAHPLFAI